MFRNMSPRYLDLWETGELRWRAKRAKTMLEDCQLCPRRCRANRLLGEKGICRINFLAKVASFGPHFGEEAPLVGWRGSGAVFFSGCNLGCVFCQNADISHRGHGDTTSTEKLAEIFMELQGQGCHNLNLVTPTHVLPQILDALDQAAERGFELPLVWNCGGYESATSLELLDGIVDIYMPDFKMSDSSAAGKYLRAADYPEVAKAAVKEMHRQVGDLEIDDRGLARRGLLVRHLVMPEGVAGTKEVIRFLAEEVSPNTYINIMDQYRPSHDAVEDPVLGLEPHPNLWKYAVETARRAGLRVDRG